MTRKNDFSTVLNQMLNSRNSSPNSSIISNVLILIKRHIQISPHKHFLPFQVRLAQVTNTLLRHRNDSPGSFPGAAIGANFRSNMDSERRVSSGEAEADEGGGGAE